MAVYKVIQDIEAEDKLLGPLGLKQFIYAIIAVACGFMCFKLTVETGLGPARFLVVFVFLLPMLLFGLLAAPLGGIQSTETWLLAKLRFMLKPQRRIWDQSGIKELVTITAPKKVQKQYTDGLSQTEVKSRLSALASTLDSRGWAVKNVNVNMYTQPGYFSDEGQTDRLVSTEFLPQDVPAVDIKAEDDILDPQSNATAHHLDRLMHEAETKSKLSALEKFNDKRAQNSAGVSPTPAPDFWFMHKQANQQLAPNETMFTAHSTIQPGQTNDDLLISASTQVNITPEQEQALLANARQGKARKKLSQGNMPAINDQHSDTQPASSQPKVPQDAIISLANNDDISVATAQKEANRIAKSNTKTDDSGEIIVRLH